MNFRNYAISREYINDGKQVKFALGIDMKRFEYARAYSQNSEKYSEHDFVALKDRRILRYWDSLTGQWFRPVVQIA